MSVLPRQLGRYDARYFDALRQAEAAEAKEREARQAGLTAVAIAWGQQRARHEREAAQRLAEMTADRAIQSAKGGRQ